MPRAEVVSLEEFSEWHGEAKGVEIESNFTLPPYVPAENIGVSLSGIATLANMGRLSAVRFGVFSEEGEVSYTASSINSDGSASAGAIRTGSIARSKSIFSRHSDNNADFPRGEYRIKINAAHPDLDDKILRKPEPWANLFDKGIKDGLKNASRQQLLEPERKRKIKFGVHNAIDALYIGGISIALFHQPDFIPFYFGYRTLDDATGVSQGIADKILKRPPKDYEKSALLNLPLDRYFAVKAIASSKKIVKTK